MGGPRDGRGAAGPARTGPEPPGPASAWLEIANAFFVHAPDAIIVVDETEKIVSFNPMAEIIFSRSSAEVLGKDMIEMLLPQRRRQAHRTAYERFLRTGDETALSGIRSMYATSALRADGSEFAAESTLVPVTTGGARFCCEIIRDTSNLASALAASEQQREALLTAERDARRRAADSAERLIRLVTALPAAALVEDERRQIILVNDRFREMFQIPVSSAEDLIGTHAAPVIEKSSHLTADPDHFALRVRQIVAARELIVDEEITFADGRIYDLDFVPVIVGSEWHGQLWLFWDVTERRAIERQRERLLAAELKARKATEHARSRLEEQNKSLRELDELKTQFMSTLSHELRSPLTSIVSFTDLLKDTEPPLGPQAAEFVDIIERNSGRLLRLVSDMLLLGRIEGGSLPLELAPVSAAELLEEAVRARSAPARLRGVTIELTAGDGPPLRVDRLRMLQVIDNLIANAIKFTEPGGGIHITARFDEDEWRIDVADSGIGIPAEDLDKIFDRFFRAANARVEAVPGTGLGLSVVRAIVSVHGGRVTVHSMPGKGTTFSLYLKAAR